MKPALAADWTLALLLTGTASAPSRPTSITQTSDPYSPPDVHWNRRLLTASGLPAKRALPNST